MREVAGVIGYQAPTVAPANRQPSAEAVFPSIRICPEVASMGASRNGSGHSKFALA